MKIRFRKRIKRIRMDITIPRPLFSKKDKIIPITTDNYPCEMDQTYSYAATLLKSITVD